MDYYITIIRENNKREVLSKHDNKEEALIAGEAAFKTSNRGDVISCITGNIVDGKVVGRYNLVKSWF